MRECTARRAAPCRRSTATRSASRATRGRNVYVTISAARSAQEEADDAFANPEPTPTSNSLTDGEADTIWLCTGSAATCDDPNDFKRFKCGQRRRSSTRPAARSCSVRRLATGTSSSGSTCSPSTTRARRATASSSSSTRRSPTNPKFDAVAGAQRRGVAARQRHAGHLRHRDHARLVHAGAVRGGPAHARRSRASTSAAPTPAAPTSCWCSSRRTPAPRRSASSSCSTRTASRRSSSTSAEDGGRFKTWSHFDADPAKRFHYYTIDFDTTNWNARCSSGSTRAPDADWEDPQTAVITFVRDDDATNDSDCFPASGPVDVDEVDYSLCDLDGGATSDPGEPTCSRTCAPAPAGRPSR